MYAVVVCMVAIFFILGFLFYRTNEGFIEYTGQTEKIESITDIIIDPYEAEEVADSFYNTLNQRNIDIRKHTVKYIHWDDIPSESRKLLRDAYQYARTTYPLPLNEIFKIAITSNDTEGGYPHTHGDVMFLSLKTIKDNTEEELRDILVHELSHIHQRQKRYLWEKLYISLGFKRMPQNWVEPKEIRNKTLSNPDTWEGGLWEYKGQHGVVLINDDAKTVRDHTYQVIPVYEGVSVTENLLRKDFGNVSQQIDHPNEITAAALQKFVKNGDTGNLKMNQVLRCWIRECQINDNTD